MPSFRDPRQGNEPWRRVSRRAPQQNLLDSMLMQGRINTLVNQMPTLGEDPRALFSLAAAPTSTEDMMEAALAAVGTTGVMSMVDDFKSMPNEIQITRWSSMGAGQQQAYADAGYTVPTLGGGGHDGFFSSVSFPLSGKLKAVADAVAFDSVLGVETPWSEWSNSRDNIDPPEPLMYTLGIIPQVAGMGVRGFLWAGESGLRQVTRMYRTSQLYATAFDQWRGADEAQAQYSANNAWDASAGWSPRSIWRAWNAAESGETLFKDEALELAAGELEINPSEFNRVGSDLWLAQKFASNLSLEEIVEDLYGIGYEDPNFGGKVEEIYRRQTQMGAGLVKAVDILDKGKFSIGRDAARMLGMDHWEVGDPFLPDQLDWVPLLGEMDAHTVVSGSVDALLAIRGDPMLWAGKGLGAARRAHVWQAKGQWGAELDMMQDIATMQRNMKHVSMKELRTVYADAELAPFMMRHRVLNRAQKMVDLQNARSSNRILERMARAMTVADELDGVQKLKAAGFVDTNLGHIAGMADETVSVDDAIRVLSADLGVFMQENKAVGQLWTQARKYHAAAKANGSAIDAIPLPARQLRRDIDALTDPDAWWDFYRTIDGRKALFSSAAVGINPDVAMIPRINFVQQGIWHPTKRWARARLSPAKFESAHFDELAEDLNAYLRITARGEEIAEGQFDELLNWREKADLGMISGRLQERGFEDTAKWVKRIGAPARSTRRFVRSMGHYVPESRALEIGVDASILEMQKLAQMGALANLPQQYIDEMIGLMAVGNPGVRAQVAKRFTADVLVRSGFLTNRTKVATDVWERFVLHLDQAYGISDGDRTMMNGVESKSGLFTTPMAGTEFEDVIMMPNFKALAQATRHVNMTRHLFLGVAHMPVVDAAMNRFWKPAQLLRIGFVPRAAGEELIAFGLRRGFREYFGTRAALKAAGYKKLRTGEVVIADAFHEASIARPAGWASHTMRKMVGMTDELEVKRALDDLWADADFIRWDEVELGKRLDAQVLKYRDQHGVRSWIRSTDEKVLETSLRIGDFWHELALKMGMPSKQEIAGMISRQWANDESIEAAEHLLTNVAYQRYQAEIAGMTFDPYRNINSIVTRERHIPFKDSMTGITRHIPMKIEISKYHAIARSDAAEFAHNYSALLRRMHNDPTGEELMHLMARFVNPTDSAAFMNTLDEVTQYTGQWVDEWGEHAGIHFGGVSGNDRFRAMVKAMRDPEQGVPADVLEELHGWALSNTKINRANILHRIEDPLMRDVVGDVLERRESYSQPMLQRMFSPHFQPDDMIETQDDLVAVLTDAADYHLRRTMNQETLHGSIKANTNGKVQIIAPIGPHKTRMYFPMAQRGNMAGLDQLFQQGHLVDEFVDSVMVKLPGQLPEAYREQLYEMIGGMFGDREYFGQMITHAGTNAVRGRDWIPLSGLAGGNPEVAKVITDVLSDFSNRYADEIKKFGGSPVIQKVPARMSYTDLSTDTIKGAAYDGFDISRPVGGTDFYRLGPHLTMEAMPITDEATLIKARNANGDIKWMDPKEVLRSAHLLDPTEVRLINELSGSGEWGPLGDILHSLFERSTKGGTQIWELDDHAWVGNQLRIYDELGHMEANIDSVIEDLTLKIQLHRGDPNGLWDAMRNDDVLNRAISNFGDNELEARNLVTALANDPALAAPVVESAIMGNEQRIVSKVRHMIDRITDGTADWEEIDRIVGSGVTEEIGTRMLSRQMVDEMMVSLSSFNLDSTPRDDVLFELLDGMLTNVEEYADPVHMMAVARMDDLPQHVYGPRMMARNEMTWDRMVRFGFDEVISPGIANIARTPHYSANASIAMKQLRPMLDDLLDDGASAVAKHLARGDVDVMKKIDSLLVQNWDEFTRTQLRNMDEAQLVKAAIPSDPGLKLVWALEQDDVKRFGEAISELNLNGAGLDLPDVMTHMKGRKVALQTYHDVVAQRAYELTIPFIDDHRIRSQFQEFMSSLIPFWFAEEQFLKRWARGLYENPAALRKGQLLMGGMREMGMIRKDQYGNEVFVMPGSEAAMTVLGPILGLRYGDHNVGAVVSNPLTTRTEYMFPGMRTDVGRPEFGPLVAIGVNKIANAFPEFSDFRDTLLGDMNANRYGPTTGFVPETLDMLLPSSATRLFLGAVMNDFDESSLRSAEIEAIAYLTANDLDPGPAASDMEMQKFNDQVTSMARTIMVTRAATGFFGGASYAPDYGEIELSEEFRELLNSGVAIPDAIDALTERHGGWVTPYTVFSSQSTSGAPIPSTAATFEFMTNESDFIGAFPMAAPWFLPQERPRGEYGIAERRARAESIAIGLRDLDTPEEFLREIYFQRAAEPYFERQERYREQRLAMQSIGAAEEVRTLDAEWNIWADSWKVIHPTFAADIQAGTSRVRREALVTQMQDLVANPDVIPDVAHKEQLLDIMRSTIRFTTEMERLSNNQTGDAQEMRRLHRRYFYEEGLRLVAQYPELAPFFSSVVRPLIGLDQIERIEFENPQLAGGLAG